MTYGKCIEDGLSHFDADSFKNSFLIDKGSLKSRSIS